jgi:hypothetical protein
MKRSGIKRKRSPASEIPQESREIVRLRDADTCVRCLTFLGGNGHWQHRHCPCVGVLLCGVCHSEVHADPLTARENGWIVSRYEREPATVPFKTGTVWLFPMCSGNVYLVNAGSLSEAVDKRFARGTTTNDGAGVP